jgi:hypothetical protein
VVDPALPNWAESYWDPLSTLAWEYGANEAEGWALIGAGLLAAAATYGAVVLSHAKFANAAAAALGNR